MKALILILLTGCATRFCQPSKGSKDYAWKVHNVKGDTAYVHRFERGVRITRQFVYECLPDSVKKGTYIK